jgi:LPS sulfotransferase NodH
VKSYLICATPRSGSSLLCEALRNTGLAGKPDEYFGPMHVSRWHGKWQTNSAKEYLDKVISYSGGDDGVVGLKVMRLYWQNFISHLQEAEKHPKSTDFDILNHSFPGLQFIFITRRDKVRQGISWMKFLQGAAWHWEADEPQVIKHLEYRPEVIKDFITQTAIHESTWLAFFRQNNIDPFIVVYEDFVKAYEKTAKEILAFLGIACDDNLVFAERRFKKQADDLTEAWVQRFLEAHKRTEKMENDLKHQ